MFSKKSRNILVADVGGTKTALAVINQDKKMLFKKIYSSRQITNFTDTVLEFMNLAECKEYKIIDAAIAVSGIINKNKDYARPTNLEWTIDVNNLLVRTPLHNIVLLNDFKAIGLYYSSLKDNQYIELTTHGRNPSGTIAIIGAGTGLGMSILAHNNGEYYHISSEGGHLDFSIVLTDKTDVNLELFLIKKKLYTDTEDIISGRGITNIYTFLLTQKIKHDPKIKTEISKSSKEEKPALIMKYALEDKDLVCIKTLELFIRYYARAARNLALTTLCSEMIISGGIAPKIISAMQDSFVEEFMIHNSVEIRKFLERIPILVLIDPDIGLYGASNTLLG